MPRWPGFLFREFAGLRDGVLELRLSSVVAEWPAYLFEIHPIGAEASVGRISIRFDDDPSIALYAGNIAYEIDPGHRGHGHAARACRLLRLVARHHGVDELWIVTAPENVASRRTAEAIGAEFIDTLAMPPDTDMYAQGVRQARRYRWRP